MTCGCGGELKLDETYQVEDQLHCEACMKDAVTCKVQVLVRKIDVWEAIKHEQAGQALTA